MAVSRRNVFAGIAALPAMVPVVAAARPLATGGPVPGVWTAFATGGISRGNRFVGFDNRIALMGETVHECILPLRRGANIGVTAVIRVDKPLAPPPADEPDDRQFGWEG